MSGLLRAVGLNEKINTLIKARSTRVGCASDCRKSLLLDVLLLYHSALTMITGYDSSVCRIALLGFAIRVGTPVNMKEGDTQGAQENTF